MVMGHLQPRPLIATLDIEPLIRLGTIQYRLITPDLLADMIQRLNNPQPQLLPLLILPHHDILDMPYTPQIVYELLLHHDAARADHPFLFIAHHEAVIPAPARRAHPLVPLGPGGFRDVAHRGQILQRLEVALGVVTAGEGPHGVPLRKGREDC